MEEVIAVEGTPQAEGPVEGSDEYLIAYATTVVGLDAILVYGFCDDGLYQVMYSLTESHTNNSLYIDDYETFKNALKVKYGKPLIDSENWENDSKKSYYADKKGDALCYGYLDYSTHWLLDRTRIGMYMKADNYNISTLIGYTSNEISPDRPDYSDEI